MTEPLNARERRLLDWLVDIADRGERAPTNEAIATYLRLGSPGTASGVLAALEQKGWIAVERGNRARVVTIMATGRRTAGHVDQPHWRQRQDAVASFATPDRAREREQQRQRRRRLRELLDSGAPPPVFDLSARIASDQAARLAERMRWLDEEKVLYGLPTRGRLIDEMPA